MNKNMFLLSISLLISYAILVMGDWLILRNNNISITTKAASIQNLRIETEDKLMKAKAIKDGYMPPLSPSVMNTIRPNYPLVAGLPYADTYLCNEGYGLIKYRSDRFGFRNNDEDWDTPNINIMIGDSFVHGACVDSDQTLPEYFEKITNEDILNLGIGGNNPNDYLAYAHLFIPKINPSNVYLVFYPNDNGVKNPSMIKQFYVDGDEELFSPSGLKLFDTEFFYSEGLNIINTLRKIKPTENKILKSFRAVIRHSSLPMITELLTNSFKSFEETKQAINSISGLCRSYDCNLTVVFIPNSNFWQPDPRADDYANDILKLTSELGLQFVDGRKLLDRSKDSKDYAIKGGHLAPLGYKKMAKGILLSESK
jgi:hypothetical protein